MTKYNFSDNVRKDEFTANFENYVLSRMVAGEDRELLMISVRKVKVDDEDVLVIEPQVRSGAKVFPMNSMWSRNTLTPADIDRLQNFAPVDAIVRYGTFIDDKGMAHVSASPKVVALIDADRKVFIPSGAKPEYVEKGE